MSLVSVISLLVGYFSFINGKFVNTSFFKTNQKSVRFILYQYSTVILIGYFYFKYDHDYTIIIYFCFSSIYIILSWNRKKIFMLLLLVYWHSNWFMFSSSTGLLLHFLLIYLFLVVQHFFQLSVLLAYNFLVILLILYSFIQFLWLVYFSAPTLVILWYYMRTAFYLFCYSLLVYFFVYGYIVAVCYNILWLSTFYYYYYFTLFDCHWLQLFLYWWVISFYQRVYCSTFFYFLLRIYIFIRSNPVIPNSFNFYFTENSSKPHFSNHVNVIGLLTLYWFIFSSSTGLLLHFLLIYILVVQHLNLSTLCTNLNYFGYSAHSLLIYSFFMIGLFFGPLFSNIMIFYENSFLFILLFFIVYFFVYGYIGAVCYNILWE